MVNSRASSDGLQAPLTLFLSFLMFLDQSRRHLWALTTDRFEFFSARVVVGNEEMLNLLDQLRIQGPQRFQRGMSVRFGCDRNRRSLRSLLPFAVCFASIAASNRACDR